MTDLQIKYRTLEETKRANRMKESLSDREVKIKEYLAPAQYDEIRTQIENIKANTSLTKTKKVREIVGILNDLIKGASISMEVGQKIMDSANPIAIIRKNINEWSDTASSAASAAKSTVGAVSGVSSLFSV